MIRKDIEIIQRDECVIIQSNKHFFSFSRNHTGYVTVFCTEELTSDMIRDLILSGIVSIMSCEKGNLTLSPKFGYDMLKMQDVIIGIFEKYNL